MIKTAKSSKSCKDFATDELIGSLALGYARIIKIEEGFLDKIKKSIKSDIDEVSSMLNRK